jgi:TPR repeat protein
VADQGASVRDDEFLRIVEAWCDAAYNSGSFTEWYPLAALRDELLLAVDLIETGNPKQQDLGLAIKSTLQDAEHIGKLASSGDAAAQIYLALLCSHGFAGSRDVQQASRWLERAAGNGSRFAKWLLSNSFLDNAAGVVSPSPDGAPAAVLMIPARHNDNDHYVAGPTGSPVAQFSRGAVRLGEDGRLLFWFPKPAMARTRDLGSHTPSLADGFCG